MEKKAKLILIGLLAILGVSLFINLQTNSAKQLVMRQRDELKEENAGLKAQIDEANSAIRRLQEKISSLNKNIESVGKEKEDIQKRLNLVSSERDGLMEKLQDFSSTRQENDGLRQQLKTMTDSKSDIEKKLTDLQKENSDLNAKLSQAQGLLEENQRKSETLREQLINQESIELEPIIVRPQQEAAEEMPLKSDGVKILAVNKDDNFVVINSGLDAGVKTGDIFKVYRKNKFIARLEVIQARQKISACDIKSETSSPKVGDSVK
jgi:predicted nuclease with TOPRIM domain